MKYTIASFALMALLFLAFPQNTDINLLANINLNRNKNLDPIFQFLTNISGYFSLGFSLVLISIGFKKKDNFLKLKGQFILGTLMITALISTTLKYSIHRARPFETYSYIEKLTSGGSPSFPSGHTSDVFALAAALSMVFPKWYIIAPAFLWAGIIGYSRMDLGVHYPSDVLLGALLGTSCAYMCSFLYKKKFARNGQ
ncbi:MAG: phosphatase PAP2 family protein [Cytophagales bacterium]|nr:phosphatase PAP2 family protein [Cytophagales bacterium]